MTAEGTRWDAVRVAAIPLLALGLALFGAGQMPLTDPDEGRYAEISREMLVSGDWLVPTLFGLPYLEKPPLLYWLTALAFHLFGPSELVARLVPALAAAACIGVVVWLGCRHVSRRAGALGGTVLALSGLYFVLARTLVADMLFTASLTGALGAFLAMREGRLRVAAGALVFWLALATATMAKGPAALVIVALVVLVDAALARSWRFLARPALWAPLPLFVALTLPWFALIQERYPEFLSFYIWKEHLHRAGGAEHAAPIYWFVPWLLAGLLPWTPFAAIGLGGWIRDARAPTLEGRVTCFLLVWALVVFTIFSLAAGKLATYILPMFPPVAILVACFLERAIDGEIDSRRLAGAFAVLGGLFVIGAPVLAVAGWLMDVDGGWLAYGGATLPLVVGGVVVVAWRRRPPAETLGAVIATTVCFYLGLANLAPAVGEVLTARPHIRRLERDLRPEDAFAFWGGYFPSAAFYLHRTPYLVGVRPELRLGMSLLESAPQMVPDLATLESRTPERRLFFLTDWRDKRERELEEAFGALRAIERNGVSRLWLRQRRVEPEGGSRPVQAIGGAAGRAS